MKYHKLAVGIACLGLTVATASTSLYAKDKSNPPAGTPAPEWKHPVMHSALQSLREAHRGLQAASEDFAGHRRKAIQTADEAIQEVEAALKLDNDFRGTPALRPRTPVEKADDKAEGKKLMREARRDLQTAESELRKAVPKFAGHRLKAIQLIQEAIKHVDEGLEASK